MVAEASLPQLFASRFIARPDVIARQHLNGSWSPDKDQGFTKSLIEQHIAGDITLGHYLLNADNQCKLFAFDVDLQKVGAWVEYPSDERLAEIAGFSDKERDDVLHHETIIHEGQNPRELWANKTHPSRSFLMGQMRSIAELLSSTIRTELDIPVACSYSGSKGIHVYGFTGLIDAADARGLAYAVLEHFGDRFRPLRGDQYYVDQVADHRDGFSNFTIEVFPKQDTIRDDGFGNLMRLPLGRNLKAPNSKTFLLDQSVARPPIKPHPAPAALLTDGNPWATT